MVHFENAVSADVAVMSALGLHTLAYSDTHRSELHTDNEEGNNSDSHSWHHFAYFPNCPL